jgi:hypothetical protein
MSTANPLWTDDLLDLGGAEGSDDVLDPSGLNKLVLSSQTKLVSSKTACLLVVG